MKVYRIMEVEREENEETGLDAATVMVMFVMSLVSAIAIVVFICAMFLISYEQIGYSQMIGIILGLTGVLFSLFVGRHLSVLCRKEKEKGEHRITCSSEGRS